VTGSFTTAAPLANNLTNANIGLLVTAYSFNDGVTTYTNSDAQSRKDQFIVTTDGSGAITNYRIFLHRWQTVGATPVTHPAPASGRPTAAPTATASTTSSWPAATRTPSAPAWRR